MSPLVGRGRELDELRRALDELLDGTGGLILLTGEAGMGKTSLVRQVAHDRHLSWCAGGLQLWG